MSPLTTIGPAAVAGAISAALSHVSFVSDFGSSCSQALFAKRPSYTLGSGRNTTSSPLALPPEPRDRSRLQRHSLRRKAVSESRRRGAIAASLVERRERGASRHGANVAAARLLLERSAAQVPHASPLQYARTMS